MFSKQLINKRVFLAVLLCIGSGVFVCAQDKSALNALKAYASDETSLFEEISGIKKKTDRFNLYMNMRGSANGEFDKTSFEKGYFRMDQFRIEAKGDLNNWLSYRFKQRLNFSADGSNSIDNLPSGIDYAGIGLTLSSRFSMFLGKQGVAYGGIEYDLNPIGIYQYVQFIERNISFLTGINLKYKIKKDQELNVQIVNNRVNNDLKKMYFGDLRDAKLPFIYSLSWNGTIGSWLKTRWSVNYSNEAHNMHKLIIALGNKFKFGKLDGYFDYTFSQEESDRTALIRDIIVEESGFKNLISIGTRYNATILHINYRITPHWNILARAATELAKTYKNTRYATDKGVVNLDKGKFFNTLNYSAGVEYYPFSDSNFRFFTVYSGRAKYMKEYGKVYNLTNTATSKLSVGFVYLLQMF